MFGTLLQALVDAEATGFVGAAPHERTETRLTQRNGTREKTVTTVPGDLTIKISWVRTGSFLRRCSRRAGASTWPCTR